LRILRIVDILEHPYVDFAGLNLMYETRLGLAKHKSTYDNPETRGFNETCPSLEGQIADVSDRIAYNCHDLEDAMRAGLLDSSALNSLSLATQAAEKINAKRIEDPSIRRNRTSKAIIEILVSDVIKTSSSQIRAAGISSVSDVYNCGEYLIKLSEVAETALKEFESFLMASVYSHPSLVEVQKQINPSLGRLYDFICKHPGHLPVHYKKLVEQNGIERTAMPPPISTTILPDAS
jgi:dGTPase